MTTIVKRIYKQIRAKFFTIIAKSQLKSYGKGLCINHYCRFAGNVIVGSNCHFNGMKIGGGNIRIGNNFHSGEEIMILAQSHNYNGDALPYDSTYIVKNVIIDDNVWIGSRVLIVGDVHIGEGAIIGAGSVVTNDVPPLAIFAGGRIVKYRDKEKYYKLKAMERYH